MSYHARTILTPAAGWKRKEREAAKILAAPRVAAEPGISNQLLAGYMAHEFLTKGTLLGEKWGPARAEAALVKSRLTEPNKKKCGEAEPSGKGKQESYAEVAGLLKGDGAHVAGVVNPSQLARWIQM